MKRKHQNSISSDDNEALLQLSMSIDDRNDQKQTIVLPSGESITKEQLLSKLIDLHPNTDAYCKLALILINDNRSSIILLSDCDPTYFLAYYKLAMTLPGGESITLNNGQSMTEQ
ncbi:hypothetical protein PPL_12124 [Heterostelium album PN500]|uniref:Uncharacterized protein n=1 Tax=Heterostelium pallidum (strain ATCC 26659 / Pp 5 / PN500) TaxID=670386 RepID=D3BLS0_HETP5|nr:hypothetical protein PPL_12124 [Heterostelium album PN500]EFA77521.1 hypothetical protein PPL_12124 [Heterostelium album PN500]|eukprot:XP_020429649.1 hypothetical protein PPL_12124 [Heterostelium album PN500]